MKQLLYILRRKSGAMFSGLSGEYNNDDLKNIFTDSFENEVWQFIKKIRYSDILLF